MNMRADGFKQILGLAMMLMMTSLHAATNVTLDDIEYSVMPGGNTQIHLSLSGPAPEAGSFTIDNPARIAVDLPNVKLNLEKRNISIANGTARDIRVAEAGSRTRVVISLVSMVPYEVRTENNDVYVTLNKNAKSASRRAAATSSGGDALRDVDFRRGEDAQGIVSIKLPSSNSVVNVEEKGKKVVVDFINIRVPSRLERRLDVNDFATPISTVDMFNTASGARMVLTTVRPYEYLAYQAGDAYTVSVNPISEKEQEEAKKDKQGYTGEKLSLNFQNIEVRAVLQLLADFTGLNIVASDTVQGNITLRLKNVPWDQALDIILKTRGLGMRKSGNVVLIAPNDELAAREAKELAAKQKMVELAPLVTEYYQINYAKASELATLLKQDKNSILSERGNVTLDERTNTLMVLDTAEKQEDIARLIKRLDIAVRQVMIESRIVIANDDFSRDLGVRTGVSRWQDNDFTDGGITNSTTGTAAGTDTLAQSAYNNFNATGNPYPVTLPSALNRYNVNLPAAGNPASIALAILGRGYLVDLELSAMQTEGKGEVVSNPRVITSNQKQARIKQGVEIPYQQASSSGATAVSFKEAVLSLSVTPQITPDDRVIMDLEVSKDSVGGIYGGVPSINTRSVNTQVLVDNGDTVVLGGIYEQSSVKTVNKVPLLGDIPLLGYLFRNESKTATKAELLIFVTPKIIKESLRAGMK